MVQEMSEANVVYGQCKLAACSPAEQSKDCTTELAKLVAEFARHQTTRLEFLQRELAAFIAKPGCNVQMRAARMERLKWALEESRTRI